MGNNYNQNLNQSNTDYTNPHQNYQPPQPPNPNYYPPQQPVEEKSERRFSHSVLYHSACRLDYLFDAKG